MQISTAAELAIGAAEDDCSYTAIVMGGADDFDACFVDRRAEGIAQRRIGNREVENIDMLRDDEAGVFFVHIGGGNGIFDLFHTTTLKCRCGRIHIDI